MTAAPLGNPSKTATRLLRSTSKNSYDPELDIDWAAPVELDKKFMPFERVSLYGTDLWDRMSEQQRLELSRHEIASVASAGLWFEIILIQLLARWAYHRDPQDPRTQYALAEIGDETRHIIMFAKSIARLGAPTYRPRRPDRRSSRRCSLRRRSPTGSSARWSTTRTSTRSSGW
jgi:hypothetical protein